MDRPGHTGITLALYTPIAFVLFSLNHPILAVLGALGMMAGTNIPDVDTLLPFLTHRRETHTFGFAIVIFLFTGASMMIFALALPPVKTFVPNYLDLTMFFSMMTVLGVCSHLIGDLITPHGIRPLRPVSDRKFTLDLVRSGNTTANGALFFLGTVLLMMGIWFGASV